MKISSIAAIARKVIDGLPIKTTTKYRNFEIISKVIERMVDKVSNSVYVIIEGDKSVLHQILHLRGVLFCYNKVIDYILIGKLLNKI